MSAFSVIEGDVVLRDSTGNAVGVVLDGAVYRLQTEDKIASWFGSVAPTVGQKAKAASLPITIASDQDPLPIIITSVPASLPALVNPVFSATEGGIIANAFKRTITYVVPVGYNGYLIRFSSYQGEVAQSRLVAETEMGTHNISTDVFTAGSVYAVPAWTSVVEAEVTTVIQSGAGNVVFTVTYTNELGVGGRTGTITLPRGSAVGARAKMSLQTGDVGARSLQAVTATPNVTGVVKLLGFVQLTFHDDQDPTIQTTSYFTQEALAFPTGTVLGFEYAGGTVAKVRRFDALIQLVQ